MNAEVGEKSRGGVAALRLARFYGMSERFWLNLQVAYDLEVERDELGDRLELEVVVLAALDGPGCEP